VLVGGAVDYDDAIAAKIGEEARDMTGTAPYRIYTKDFDTIEPFPVEMAAYQDDWLTRLDDRTRQSVGVMQKEIQRMMAARSQCVNVPGFRSGRLHTAGLHRLAAGDDRVFRRLHVNESKDVAVELLIDNSGSMQGIKMETAMEAGYALSTTLERVGIQHEVIGFTTKWHPWAPEIQEARQAAVDSGIPYTRYEPIYMPVYKGFDERLTSEVKRRFAAAPHQDFMGSNVDGESLEMAAYRLLRRKETRKVLLVLSDGKPIADGDVKALRRHLKDTVKAVEARGIETVGIGILTDAPRHYFPKFALLNNAAELPKCVMGELKRILLS
jgi:cobalamin biosynthesis protein CobT